MCKVLGFRNFTAELKRKDCFCLSPLLETLAMEVNPCSHKGSTFSWRRPQSTLGSLHLLTNIFFHILLHKTPNRNTRICFDVGETKKGILVKLNFIMFNSWVGELQLGNYVNAPLTLAFITFLYLGLTCKRVNAW